MSKLNPVDSSRTALNVLRVVVALVLIAHGVARVVLGIVDDFGIFLAGVGLPLGAALAWTITAGEIVGGSVLALGRWVRPLALYFAGQLLIGIVLVHAREGWFVVGAGRNGMEYSVFLITLLVAVAYAATPERSAALERLGAELGSTPREEAANDRP